MCWCLGPSLSMLLSLNSLYAQSALAANQPTPPAPQVAGNIHGVVKADNMPIPGAAVSISVDSSTQKISTWSDVDGSYTAAVPSYGSYMVSVQMIAFANSTQHVVINADHSSVVANFELTLLSRLARRLLSREGRQGKRAHSADFKLYPHSKTWPVRIRVAIRLATLCPRACRCRESTRTAQRNRLQFPATLRIRLIR